MLTKITDDFYLDLASIKSFCISTGEVYIENSEKPIIIGLGDAYELRNKINMIIGLPTIEFKKEKPMTIDDLGLPEVRALNVLRGEYIETVEQLLNYTEKELFEIPNSGKVCVRQIKQALARHGLSLRKQKAFD